MKTYTERKALELLALPCLGYHTYSPDGDEFDCEYQAECICEDCICNFAECHGHIDPITRSAPVPSSPSRTAPTEQ